VFSSLYRTTGAPLYSAERLVEIEAPAVASPAFTLDSWAEYDLWAVTFAGDGAVRYTSLLPAVDSSPKVAAGALLAGAIGCMAEAGAPRGFATSPAAIHPLYVRRPDAELHREHTQSR